MKNNIISALDINSLELHYWFEDRTHGMNAVVYNKCEHEFLDIAKEIASKLKIDVEIEIEPLKEGGLRSWFRFRTGTNNSEALQFKIDLRKAFLIYLCTQVLLTPLTTTLEELSKHAIEYFFEDPKIKELKRQKEILELELDIEIIKAETAQLCKSIDENVIKKRKSNYYHSINEYKKVVKVSFSPSDENNNKFQEYQVVRNQFEQHILLSDELEPEIKNCATIEIVSPVLKKGKYKWVGIYDGEVIQFTMKSNEFKTLIQTGKIEFKNGSAIICNLTVNKKINNEGLVKITGYEVPFVEKYFENDTPVETPEGKKNRQKIEADKMQRSLFDEY